MWPLQPSTQENEYSAALSQLPDTINTEAGKVVLSERLFLPQLLNNLLVYLFYIKRNHCSLYLGPIRAISASNVSSI